MKSNLYNHTFFISIIAALLLCTNGIAQQIDLSNYSMRFVFKTIKQADNSRLLEVSFIGFNDTDRKDVKNNIISLTMYAHTFLYKTANN